MPWHIPQDFKFFKDITMGYKSAKSSANGMNAVIMGANTWRGMPNIQVGKIALPGRFNIILDNQNPEKL